MSQVYIPKAIREKVIAQAKNRCGYCQIQQLVSGIELEFDHLQPLSQGGTNTEDNLWLACSACNDTKNKRLTALDPETGQVVALFNPRQQNWNEHFIWTSEGTIVGGITAVGRATVAALNLNRSHIINSRVIWVIAGWHPPKD